MFNPLIRTKLSNEDTRVHNLQDSMDLALCWESKIIANNALAAPSNVLAVDADVTDPQQLGMSQVICYLCGQKGHYKQDSTLTADKKQHFPTQQHDTYTASNNNISHRYTRTNSERSLQRNTEEPDNKPTISQGLPTIILQTSILAPLKSSPATHSQFKSNKLCP